MHEPISPLISIRNRARTLADGRPMDAREPFPFAMTSVCPARAGREADKGFQEDHP